MTLSQTDVFIQSVYLQFLRFLVTSLCRNDFDREFVGQQLYHCKKNANYFVPTPVCTNFAADFN